ncbi:MAG: high-potential iron-sulfur protein [Sandaracinaceae bacterium]
MSKEIGRREAARRFLTVLGAAAVAPAALAACGGEEGGGELSCTDTTGLQPAAVTMRQQQNYVDASENAEQNCANCNFYTAPSGDGCGACSVLMNSPVHPDGHCGLWAPSA